MAIAQGVGLIICTRNRAARIASLLAEVRAQSSLPEFTIVVDSSDDLETLLSTENTGIEQLTYIRTSAGLPHQRNVGVAFAMQNFAQTNVIAFLDDDVALPIDYFEKVHRNFQTHHEAACIAGYDLNLNISKPSILEKALSLRANGDYGRLLPSGIAVPVNKFAGIIETDWAPGHSLNVAAWALQQVKFDSNIRMYGEDVEFLLRLARVGKIYISSDLGVYHNPEKSGRDGLAAAEAYNAGFRWWLTKKYPQRFSKPIVLFSSFALMAGYIVKSLVRRDRNSLWRALGLVTFFVRLALRQRVTQTVH